MSADQAAHIRNLEHTLDVMRDRLEDERRRAEMLKTLCQTLVDKLPETNDVEKSEKWGIQGCLDFATSWRPFRNKHHDIQ